MRRFIRSCLAAAIIALFAGNAHANVWDWITGADQGPELSTTESCNAYADAAMEAAQENENFTCHLPADRYGKDRQGHFWWCMGQPKAAADDESAKRRKQISSCHICRPYATKAAAMAHENEVFDCKGSGALWGTNPEDHFQWCFNVQQNAESSSEQGAATDFIKTQTDARAASLFFCKSRIGEANIAKCSAYTDEAIKAVTFMSATPLCAPLNVGGRFSPNRDNHMAWCIRKLNTPFEVELQSEADGRTIAIRACDENTSVDYGGCPGCGNRPAGQLWPEQSPGPSPFGAADKLDKSPSQAPKGGANLNKSIGDIPKAKVDVKRVTVSPRKEKASTGFNTAKPTPAGESAMDRLGGAPAAPAASGGFNTAKPNTARSVSQSKSEGTGATAGGPSGGFNTAKPNAAPLLPTLALPPPRSKSGM